MWVSPLVQCKPVDALHTSRNIHTTLWGLQHFQHPKTCTAHFRLKNRTLVFKIQREHQKNDIECSVGLNISRGEKNWPLIKSVKVQFSGCPPSLDKRRTYVTPHGTRRHVTPQDHHVHHSQVSKMNVDEIHEKSTPQEVIIIITVQKTWLGGGGSPFISQSSGDIEDLHCWVGNWSIQQVTQQKKNSIHKGTTYYYFDIVFYGFLPQVPAKWHNVAWRGNAFFLSWAMINDDARKSYFYHSTYFCATVSRCAVLYGVSCICHLLRQSQSKYLSTHDKYGHNTLPMDEVSSFRCWIVPLLYIINQIQL